MIEKKKQTKRGPYSCEGKSCFICFVELTKNNTRPADIAQASYICKVCHKQRDKQKYIDRKEIVREQQRVYDHNNKLKIIEAYGSKCACCGETQCEFLIISPKEKAAKQASGGKLYRWLIKNGYPKDNYQLLCYNCGGAKDFLGYCPHQNTEKEPG